MATAPDDDPLAHLSMDEIVALYDEDIRIDDVDEPAPAPEPAPAEKRPRPAAPVKPIDEALDEYVHKTNVEFIKMFLRHYNDKLERWVASRRKLIAAEKHNKAAFLAYKAAEKTWQKSEEALFEAEEARRQTVEEDGGVIDTLCQTLIRRGADPETPIGQHAIRRFMQKIKPSKPRVWKRTPAQLQKHKEREKRKREQQRIARMQLASNNGKE